MEWLWTLLGTVALIGLAFAAGVWLANSNWGR